MNEFLIAVVAIVVIAVLSRLFRRTPTIQSPTLGILDFAGDSAAAAKDADQTAIGPIFASVSESSSEPPRCNVLFLYCHFEPDGSIRGSVRGLRELIRDSGAAVAVVASENGADRYIAASKAKGYGHANLVMTLSRRGDVFPKFFQRLFTEMKRGASMPVAWVKLAPPNSERRARRLPRDDFCLRGGPNRLQMNSTATANQALQRTGSAVAAPAAIHLHFSTHRQVPRPLRLSLSLRSLGAAMLHGT